jgi:hypothetical protein
MAAAVSAADLEGLSESPSLGRRLLRAGQVRAQRRSLAPSLAAERQCVLENVHVSKQHAAASGPRAGAGLGAGGARPGRPRVLQGVRAQRVQQRVRPPGHQGGQQDGLRHRGKVQKHPLLRQGLPQH